MVCNLAKWFRGEGMGEAEGIAVFLPSLGFVILQQTWGQTWDRDSTPVPQAE